MTDFYRPLRFARPADTRQGDTLVRIAARELRDAAKWYRLVAINNLSPPYITDDPAQAGERVLLAGRDRILLPGGGSSPWASSGADPDITFGRDVGVDERGRLTVANGDLAVTGGYANLAQAIRLVLDADPGGLVFHLAYGCSMRQILGDKPTPERLHLAAAIVSRAIQADPRVRVTRDVTAALIGDVVRIDGVAVAIDGSDIPVEAVA